MQIAAIILIFILSGTAFSEGEFSRRCPDLVGRYECQALSTPRPIRIQQSGTGELTQYDIEGFRIAVDGVPISTGTDLHFRNGTLSARCENDLLIMNLDADYYPQGRFSGRMKVTMVRGRKDDGSLYVRNEGFLILEDKSLPLRGEGSCKLVGR